MRWKGIISVLVVFLFLSVMVSAEQDPNVSFHQPSIIPTPPVLSAKSYVLMDAHSGQILAQKDSDKVLPPASLTKIMTLYIISQSLQNNSIKLDDQVTVSKKAWRMGGSKMFIRVRDQVSVKDLIQGVIVASGNDATVAMAEYVAGSEDSFVDMMNQQAQLLKMTNTHYADSTGMAGADHYTTAADLAILARALILDFPKQYRAWYHQKWFTYNKIRQPNRNRLLWRYPGADGVKTGHTDKAGFCLVSSAKKEDMRLISVVLGTSSDEKRSSESIALLNYGFRFYQTHLLYQANKAMATKRVWFGDSKTLPVGVLRDLYVAVPKGQFQNVKTTITVQKNIKAPVKKGQSVGNIRVMVGEQEMLSRPVVALTDDPKGGFWRSLIDHILYLFHGLFGGTEQKVIAQ